MPTPENNDGNTIPSQDLKEQAFGELDTLAAPGESNAAPKSALASNKAERQGEPASVNPDSYERLGELARGGMGRISRAKDKRLGRVVALKELLAARGNAAERFWREALVTAKLQHPSIVPIYEAGVWPTGEPFFSMKLVSGKPFDKTIADKKSLEERLALLPTVIATCDAMAYAHTEHIIHRDLKPANVLVGDFGETVVIDWGLAKDLNDKLDLDTDDTPYRNEESHGDLTTAGAIMGTPAYMPPEQANGATLDERADVYSLGAMLYHLISGRTPFQGTTVQEILLQVTDGPPKPLEELEPRVPQELASIVRKAMAHKREDRYPNAQGLARDLKDFQAGKLVGSHQYSAIEVARKWVSQHKTPITISLLALLTLAIFGVFSVSKIIQANRVANEKRSEAEVAQKIAQDEQRRAEQSLVALLTEQGRQALMDGSPERAAVFLSGAYQRAERLGGSTPALRYLLKSALRPLDARQATIPSNSKEINALHTSPDGTRLLIIDAQKAATLWDLTKKTPLATLPEQANAAAFSHQGDLLLTYNDHELALWESASGQQRLKIKSDTNISQAALSPDNALLASIHSDKSTGLWNAKTGEALFSLPSTAPPSSLDFSPDSTRLVTTCGTAVMIWNTQSGKLLLSLHNGSDLASDATFSPDGARIVAATGLQPNDPRPSFTLWDANTGAVIATMQGPVVPSSQVTFSPDGRYLATTYQAQLISLWDAKTGDRLQDLPLDSWPFECEFSQDGKLLLTVGENDVRIWDTTRRELLLSLSMPYHNIHSAELTAGAQLVTADDQGELTFWSLAEANISRLSAEIIKPENLSEKGPFTSTDKSLALFVEENAVSIQDTKTQQTIATLHNTKRPTYAAFTPDNSRVVTLSGEVAEIWNVGMAKHLASIETPGAAILSAKFSPDGALLATTDAHFQAKLWDLSTGTLLAVLASGSDLLNLRFSDDGHALYVGSKGAPTEEFPIWSETRSAKDVADLVARGTSLLLEDGRLCPKQPDESVHEH